MSAPVMTEIDTIRRSWLLPASIILLLLLFLCSGASTQTTGDRLDAVGAALRNREFGKALDLLRPALEASPEDAQLWVMQGAAYSGQGSKTDALASFRHALKISPQYLPALQGAAQIEYEAGSPAAIPLLKHVLLLRPGDPTTQGMLAVLEYQQGNCPAAVVYFEKAGALFDAQVDALHAYATCLVKLRQLDNATRVFQRAAALKPADLREHQLLASIQLMSHQPEAAIATLGPWLGTDKPDVGTLELASTAYEDTHDTERAVDKLQQAILLDPNNVNLYLDFANVSSIHQSFQVGINVVNDGLALQPKAAPLYFARGILYVQLADYEKAQADFEKAYELDPSQSLSAAAQGMAAVQQNDLDRALATVKTGLARKPSDPALLYLQADILTQQGAGLGTSEFNLALRSAKKAIALRPTLGPAHAVLAKLYLQLGQYEAAIEQCRKALELNPKDQTSLYRLIQALRKTGSKNELPDLLKRLAQLRQDATKEEREQYRYKLVEGDAPSAQPVQP